MSNTPPYLSRAVTAAEILTQKWFPPTAPCDWVPGEYWRTPTICTLLVDLMTQTGEVSYAETLENARKKGEGWLTSCGYYDDLTCWGRFFMHAYNYLQSQSESAMAKPYLEDAKIVCDQLRQAWDDWARPKYCGGGIWWRRAVGGDPFSQCNIKAANSTFGYMETALDLYFSFGDRAYLDQGQKAYDWIAKYDFVDDQGMVWGGLKEGCTLDPGNTPVVGLQGNPLGPLWSLYEATGNTDYLDVADQIVGGTITKMAWQGTDILKSRYDAEWASQSDEWKRKKSGDTPFKGIFTRYLGAYAKNLSTLSDPARQETAATYAAFLRANAEAVWANYPGHQFGMDWHTLDEDYKPIANADELNASLQYSGVAVLTAAAKVSS